MAEIQHVAIWEITAEEAIKGSLIISIIFKGWASMLFGFPRSSKIMREDTMDIKAGISLA